MKGRIKAVGVKEVHVGMLVIRDSNIWEALPSNVNSDGAEITEDYTKMILKQLKVLVVEYHDTYSWKNQPSSTLNNPQKGWDNFYKQLPLIHSQWEKVIELDIIDSKTEFEVQVVSNSKDILKYGSIYPAIEIIFEEKLYTKFDLEKAYDAGSMAARMNYCQNKGFNFDEMMADKQDYLKDK